MRVKLTFQNPEHKPLLLPVHYNHLLQYLLYKLLPASLATHLHDQGFPYEKRTFKLFTFSRILNKGSAHSGKLRFGHCFSFLFATPKEEIIENLLRGAFCEHRFDLQGQPVVLSAVEVVPPTPLGESLFLRFLSPVTIYHTTPEKKTLFVYPEDSGFERLLLENARKKYHLLHGKDPQDLSFSLRPHRFSPQKNKVVVLFKGTPIEAWTGIFAFRGNPELLAATYETGLGNKNSAGFGMWEVWKEEVKHGLAQSQ